MSDWQPFDHGRTIGKKGSEGGVIVRDEQHALGARITQKEGAGFIAVACSIPGRIDHTCFFTSKTDARRKYEAMKIELAKIAVEVSNTRVPDVRGWEVISAFVTRFQ